MIVQWINTIRPNYANSDNNDNTDDDEMMIVMRMRMVYLVNCAQQDSLVQHQLNDIEIEQNQKDEPYDPAWIVQWHKSVADERDQLCEHNGYKKTLKQ